MRTIKFRAWDKKRNRMSESFLITDITGINYDGDGFLDNCCFSGITDTWNQFELMQFTGLHDKNGNEIYEGDIVKNVNNGYYYQIVWENSLASFGTRELDKPFRPWNLTKDWAKYHLEVIGNIYENPELLK